MKCLLAGILVLLLSTALLIIVAMGGLLILDGSAGFDIPDVHFHNRPSVWILAIMIFLMGFAWRYRRLSTPQPRSGAIR